ncbi:MAG: tetratricopeptide repeat protein [Candidatus Delongbacteria bacterium]|nr:tetratricopeptide repeat protein [Candidatus Delongbacteria bacterium]
MKKNLRTYFLLIGILIFSGCAYYNMYFNAKESYNAAEKKRIEKNITDKALYENSIKELSKILEFYPESKWVDDALLMMGLCYMRQNDNYKARKKFIELLTNYPGSDLSDQAKVHLAEVEIALKNYDEAGKLMESISADDIDIEPYKILKLTAEMSLSQGDSVKALENLLRSADKAETDIDRISVLQSSSELAEKLKDHKTSAEINKKLIEINDEREKIFLYTLKLAEAKKNLGNVEEAVSILEKITSDQEFAAYSLKGDIKLADLYVQNRMENEAYDKLDEILRTNVKDQNNGPDLSEAAYYFGEYYFDLKKDFPSAENMYDSSGYYDRRNEYYQKAVSKKNLIRDFRALRRKVEGYHEKKDSTEAKLARSEDEKMTNELIKQNKNLESSYIKDKHSLAETAMFEMGLQDTALVLFEELSKEENYPHKASRALLSLLLADSSRYKNLSDSILQKYPETAGANYIRIKRGLEPVEVVEDSARYLFNISSGKFIDSLYQEAADDYLKIARKYEDSPLSPQILQAAAMIEENKLKNYEKAAEIYTELKEKYPQSPYGRFASKKLVSEGESVKKEEKTEVKVLSESDKWYLMDRRND